MKHLYLIGGTMGVGKTTVCQCLKQKLNNCVFLDGDWCWDSNPFQVTEETKAMVLDNVCCLLNNFIQCTAYENILFCWVMHQQEIIDQILSRLNTEGCEITVISLLADESSLKSRLMDDVAKGKRTVDIVEKSIARIPLYFSLNTVRLDTSGKSSERISEEILAMR